MQLKSHFQIVNSISWSASLNCLLSGSDDTTVKLWATPNEPFTLSVVRPAQLKSLNARMRLGESSESQKDEQVDYRSQDEYMSEQDEADEDVEGWDLMTGMRH
jgi:WD40 repeat protein